jgi:NADPH-dependent 2,4-dienoyl-CoA reductase/sulfur reductase-like enzyme
MKARDLEPHYDVAVIGAGPAGLAAATAAARLGLSTVLFDEQTAPGGQIYRAVTETPLTKRDTLGAEYWHGAELARDFAASGATYVPGATVWSVSRTREIGVSIDAVARIVHAEQVIVATGALERPFPIPGWTLPGVMTAGAAQILLKSSGMVGDGRIVLAGCGPLLWLLAWQYLNAGRKIDAILDTTPRANWRAALPHLPAFLASPYLAKGLKLMLRVRRALKVIGGVEALRAEGEGRLARVVYTRGGVEESIPADLLLLHQGVAPNVNLANAIGCTQDWDGTQLCWRPRVDDWFASSVEGVSIAGDGAGIAGAEAAEQRGRIAAIGAALRLGRIDATQAARDVNGPRFALDRAERGRGFLDALYKPAPQFRIPSGETIVCRCEEVSAAQIVESVKLGVTGPNQMKSFLRCGMGPCQGRLCGLTVTELIADARGVTPDEVGYYRLRPPVKPITLAELASMPKDEAAVKAVVRG